MGGGEQEEVVTMDTRIELAKLDASAQCSKLHRLVPVAQNEDDIVKIERRTWSIGRRLLSAR